MQTARRSLSAQLAVYICRGILRGDWKAGKSVGDLRELAAGLEVNPHDAHAAQKLLEEGGVIKAEGNTSIFHENAGQAALRFLKDDFRTTYIPELTEQMKSLRISPEELMEMVRTKNSNEK